MLTTIDGKDGQEFAIDRDDLLILMKAMKGEDVLNNLSFDEDDIEGLLMTDQSAECAFHVGFEAQYKSLEEDDQTALKNLLGSGVIQSRIETAIYKVLQAAAEEADIDISSLTISEALIEGDSI